MDNCSPQKFMSVIYNTSNKLHNLWSYVNKSDVNLTEKGFVSYKKIPIRSLFYDVSKFLTEKRFIYFFDFLKLFSFSAEDMAVYLPDSLNNEKNLVLYYMCINEVLLRTYFSYDFLILYKEHVLVILDELQPL